jgi:hypothetical protein
LDPKEINVPLERGPKLLEAFNEKRKRWWFNGRGVGIPWGELDEDISAAALLQ